MLRQVGEAKWCGGTIPTLEEQREEAGNWSLGIQASWPDLGTLRKDCQGCSAG